MFVSSAIAPKIIKRILIEKISRKHLFTIKNLDEIQDAGTYTCHAKNSLGEFKENFHLQGMLSCKIIAKKNSMIIDYFYGRCTYTSISFELLTFYSNKSPYH